MCRIGVAKGLRVNGLGRGGGSKPVNEKTCTWWSSAPVYTEPLTTTGLPWIGEPTSFDQSVVRPRADKALMTPVAPATSTRPSATVGEVVPSLPTSEVQAGEHGGAWHGKVLHEYSLPSADSA